MPIINAAATFTGTGTLVAAAPQPTASERARLTKRLAGKPTDAEPPVGGWAWQRRAERLKRAGEE